MKFFREAFQDKQKLEVVLKITFTNVVAITLSVIPLPRAIPTGERYLIGLLVANFCLTIPAMAYVFTIMTLYLPFVFAIGLAAATLVLIGALVGKGLMTAMFAGVALWFSGLRFQSSALAAPIIAIAIYLSSMMSLSFHGLVETSGSPKSIAALWTTSGLTNSMAVFQNMFITVLWAVPIFGIMLVTPPFRTAKKMLSKSLVPQALNLIAGHLKALMTKPDNVQSNEFDPDQMKEGRVSYIERVNALVTVGNALGNGSSAKLVAFEPCIWLPHKVLWVPLGKMMKDITLAISIVLALGYGIHEAKAGAPEAAEVTEYGAARSELQNRIMQECAEALEQCAARMMLETLEPSIEFSCSCRHEDMRISRIELEPLVLTVQSLVTQVNKWNQFLHGSHKTGCQEIMKGLAINFGPFIGMLVVILKRLFDEITFVFKPDAYRSLCKDSKHKRGKELHYPPYASMAWYFRYALGVTILYAFQLYIPAVKSFGIPVLSADGSEVSFVGWHVIAYLGATTPTVQGTVKKGVARLVGTVCGGFSAWAATQACGLYPNTNQPGLIAWLSITTFIVTFLMIPTGKSSTLGMRHDVGAFGMYFLLTQALIALQAVVGINDINDLTLNRIVSNLTGILMAMLMAVIPPTVNGGDPVFTSNMVAAERDAVATLFFALLDPKTCNKRFLEKSMNSSFEVVTYWHRFSSKLYKDATQLIPCVRGLSADAALYTTIERSIVAGGCIVVLYSYAEELLEEEGLTCEDFQSIREEMLSLVNDSKEYSSVMEKKQAVQEASKDVGPVPARCRDTQLRAFLSFARLIMRSLDDREKELSNVKFNWIGIGK